MAMEFKQSFVVKAPPDAVWAFLTDPRRAAGALPGAAFTEQIDEKTFAGTITVKVGPVTTSYRGKARFERLDPASRTAEVVGSAQDVKGRGGADMKMTSRLVERAPGETEVNVATAVNVTGLLAQLGRGMIQDVSDQLFEKFTAAVRAELESASTPTSSAPSSSAPPANEPIQALSFGAELAGRSARRWARHPVFWVGLVVLVLILWFSSR